MQILESSSQTTFEDDFRYLHNRPNQRWRRAWRYSATPEFRPRPRTSRRSCANCAPQAAPEISEEKASGTSRARPALARLLNRLRAGDTLVVVRIDRPARSLSHLLAVIERVRETGGHFRSLGDPIDTAGPSGMLVLQIMGAIAQFERALIVKRTKAGPKGLRAGQG